MDGRLKLKISNLDIIFDRENCSWGQSNKEFIVGGETW